MIVIQYHKKCIGCGICEELQPGLWRMSRKDGKATLLNATEKKGISQLAIRSDQEDLTRKVILHCPVKIIQLR